MAEGRGLDPQCSRIQSASDGCRPPGRSTFRLADGGGARSPCLAAPSVFKTAPATRPVHHPDLVKSFAETRALERAAYGSKGRLMHKGAILDVHVVRSLRIGIHAGFTADSRRRSARRWPRGSDKQRDLAVTLRSVGLLVILRAIRPSAVCGGQWSPRVTLVLRKALVRAFSSLARNRRRTNTIDRSVDCSAGRLRSVR
jgi:hypothetical protein